MPFGTPTDPVSGTVITVAFAVANFLDPIRWLRLMTGGADPPGSNYVVRSTSTTATTWSKVTTDLVNDAAITTPKIADANVTSAKLATGAVTSPKIGTLTSNLQFTGDNIGTQFAGGSIARDSSAIPSGGYLITALNGVFEVRSLDGSIVVFHAGQADAAPLFRGNAIWHAGNVANAVSTATIQNGAVTTDKIADGTIASGDLGAGVVTNTKLGDGAVTTAKLGDDAVTFAKLFSDDTPANGDFVTINTTTGKFEYGTPASVAGVPSGLIASVRTAAAIPSGWARFADGDGRTLIGASAAAVGGLTFTENTAVGTTWLHGHTQSAHTHSMQAHVHGMNGHTHDLQSHTHSGSSLGVSGTTGGPAGTGTGGGTGATFADGSHTHGSGSMDVSGSTDGPSPNGTGGSSANSGVPSISDTGNSSTDAVQAVTAIDLMGRVVVWVIKT